MNNTERIDDITVAIGARDVNISVVDAIKRGDYEIRERRIAADIIEPGDIVVELSARDG